MKDLKELMKMLEQAEGARKGTDDEIAKIQNELYRAARWRLRCKVLSRGIFKIEKKRAMGNWHITGWMSHFAGLEGILEAFGKIHNVTIYLSPEGLDTGNMKLPDMVRLIPLTSGAVELYIGENVSLEYMRAVVQTYGIQIDISNIDKVIKQEKSKYGRFTKHKRLLIFSGAVIGHPMSKMDRFGKYLAIEEQYARMLHMVFARELKKLGMILEPEFRAWLHEFDILEREMKVIFMELGRSMYDELSKTGERPE